ncbi:hypothetical protein E2542_SST09401 [Spatholobus suberectus]|nr:hypothetical protein E2542_SST09401 [Spatholobus suberectus]
MITCRGKEQVFRDHNGEVRAAATANTQHCYDAEIAEALCLSGLFRCQSVTFETDCKILHDTWHSNHVSHRRCLHSIIQECRALINGDITLDLAFTKRMGNIFADSLAKLPFSYGYYCWIEELPQEILLVAQSDVLALAT